MQQAELLAIVENAPFFIYALDTQLCLTNANKIWFEAYERALGLRPAIGAKMPLAYQQPIHNRLLNAYERVLAGEVIEMEDEISNPTTHFKIWFSLHLSPIREEEKITGILALAWDITEKKQHESKLADWEERYQKLMDEANDAIFLADAKTGYLLYANPKAQALMQMEIAELQKMHHVELHPERFRATYMDDFKTFAGKGVRTAQIFWIINKAGEEIPVDISSSLIDFKDKTVVQGIFRDMTAHIETQKALQTQKEFYETILNHIPIDVAVLDEKRYIQLPQP